jgi:hypothetical protein
LVHFNGQECDINHTVIHAIALDTYGLVAKWHLKDDNAHGGRLEGVTENWELRVKGSEVLIHEHNQNNKVLVDLNEGTISSPT